MTVPLIVPTSESVAVMEEVVLDSLRYVMVPLLLPTKPNGVKEYWVPLDCTATRKPPLSEKTRPSESMMAAEMVLPAMLVGAREAFAVVVSSSVKGPPKPVRVTVPEVAEEKVNEPVVLPDQ